jgi:hypothetical protein
MSQNLVDAIIQGALFSTAALLASIAAFRVALAASRKEISKDKSADANCDTFDKLLHE